MLNEREMSMARELAQELIEVNHLKEKEELEKAIKTIKSMFEDVWDSIKEILPISLKETEHPALRELPNTPIKTKIPEAPFIKNHNLQFARSNL